MPLSRASARGGRLRGALCAARDAAFLQAQRSTLPAEAELPLRTLQTALDVAITEENAPVIAEMLLRHAQLAIQNETSLEALQQGSLERVIGLAKQAIQRDYKIGTLWLLLLAWSRHHAGDAAGAERCLKETTAWQQGKTLERLKEWQSETAAFLLTPLSYLPDAAEIAARTLSNKELKELAVSWAQAGQQEQALKTAQLIEEARDRSKALVAVAHAQAQVGKTEQALQTARQIADAERRFKALVAVAHAQAGQQALPRARCKKHGRRRANTVSSPLSGRLSGFRQRWDLTTLLWSSPSRLQGNERQGCRMCACDRGAGGEGAVSGVAASVQLGDSNRAKRLRWLDSFLP